jgi:DNA-binding MarR family transcriptional regulator
MPRVRAPVRHVPRPPAPEKRIAAVKSETTYVLEDQIGFRLRRAHQRATDIFNSTMAEFGLTPTQFAALAKLDDEGPLSQNRLGRLTAMDPATILGVVGRLIRQGYVAVRPDPTDGRATLISLTTTGKERVTEMKTKALVVSSQTLAPLTPAESKQLVTLLGKIL